MNEQTWMLFGGIGALLLLASLVGFVLKWRAGPGPNAVIDNLNARINAWWAMVLVIGFAFWLGQAAVILLFYGVSFYALREFITLTPTRRSDYPALVAAFYFVLPMQYLLIYIDWYSMFSIFIPVYVFLLLPILASLGGDTKHFLERASKVQWGLMLAVFCISFVPALLTLDIPGFEGRNLLLIA
ncbi:MAG: phosphatidate cytidylyltransferase, partial [Pseudomonas aeruginosa]|nr:phosphatidate cytidylyltransferase [Pseudomonas aeruginosa]